MAPSGENSTVSGNEIVLAGAANKNISGSGNWAGNLIFEINGTGPVTLLSPLVLPYYLYLINGKIITTSLNLLTMKDDETYLGGSNTSFIEGPMKKMGDDDFTFPIGAGSIFAPVRILTVPGTGESPADEFIAEYKRGNPQSTSPYGPMVGTGLDHVSSVEYWTLNQVQGSSAKNILLDVHPTSFCRALLNTFVCRWNGSQWQKMATEVVSGPTIVGSYHIGTIRSTNDLSSFISPTNAFAFGTDLPYTDNPLPVDLISFDATKINTTTSSIHWELAAYPSLSARFEVQRAGINKNFTAIGTISGSVTSRLYNYMDNDLQKGINYYRLKITDETGKLTHSRTVAVMNDVNGLLLTSLVPAVVSHTASLSITASATKRMDIAIVDMQGRMVQKQHFSVMAGNSTVSINTSDLAAGVYQLFV
ncbi:MAG: hypothetical protein WDO16_09740 [Bacteroidota bacterium]